jgi:hypothetical protein
MRHSSRKRRIAPESSGPDTWEVPDPQARWPADLPGGSSTAAERTVSVTAPTGPVRGLPSPQRTDALRTVAAGAEARMIYALVSGVQLGRRRAVCKTVGSTYVGSNPTPATTCENAPLAAKSRAGGAFPLCPVVFHLVALWTVMLRCPRTYSGRPSARLGRLVWAATTVGVRSCDGRCAPSAFLRTATDGPRWRRVQA